jgi:hypothetical protein
MGLCEYPYPWDYASQKHGGTTCDTQNHRVGNPVGLAIPRTIGLVIQLVLRYPEALLGVETVNQPPTAR